ncbi:MAG: carboxypeptidase regulatory-like domain-containing protein [Bacteroidetes bacterium]|nr:carboxypeptidase regulatory-like domain-containing protein [Bacteroidota bacterium]
MKKQLQKFKLLAVFLAMAGILLSGSAFSAVINLSGSLTVTTTGANPANTIATPPAGVLVTAQRFSGVTGFIVGTYPAYTDAAGNYAFTGLPISGADSYVVRASAALYYGAPSIHYTATQAGIALTLVFNKFGFNGGNGAFPLWEQFLSSATLDGINLVDGDQIGVFDGVKCVGLMIFNGGLVTSNVFDPTNNLISYSTLSGAGLPAGYTPGAASSYQLWVHGAPLVSPAVVTPVRSNIDGVSYLFNTFPPTGIYTHSETSLDFTTGLPFLVTIHVTDASSLAVINDATVKISKGGTLLYTLTTGIAGDYTTDPTVTPGTYIITVTRAGYVTANVTVVYTVPPVVSNVALTPSGSISGHVVLAGTGAGIGNATVTLTPGGATALTDMYGGFTITGLSDGSYTLAATKAGFTSGNGAAVVAGGLPTTGVLLTLNAYTGHFTPVSGDPSKTWTVYLSQAKIDGADMAIGDEIEILDNTNGFPCGTYVITSGLTPGTALSHDMIAFRWVSGTTGFTAGNPYTFKCWQKSSGTEFFLNNFTVETPSSWTNHDACPDLLSATYYTTVTLNFTAQNPAAVQQIINLNPGINWISSYIVHNTTDMASIIPASKLSSQNGNGSANTGSKIQTIKNTAGLSFLVTGYSAGPPVVPGTWTNNIGAWVNTEGYIFTMNSTTTLTIQGTRIDPATVIALNNVGNPNSFFMVGNLLSSPVNAATAFSELLTGGLLDPAFTLYIKNSAGRMFWNISGSLVNNIGSIIPGEGYQFLVTANATPNFRLHATKSAELNQEDYTASHFRVSGNAADNVFTIYVRTTDFVAGDEIAAFAGDKLVGATKLVSQTGKFDNPVPAFMALSTGEGFRAGDPITLRGWSATENKEYTVTYTLDNSDGAYYNTVYPNVDGQFCIATVTKSTLGINDASAIVANIYPNPAHDYLKVVADRTIDKLTLMNIMGQKVAEKSVDASSAQLNTSNIKAGVYFLRIECNGQVSTQKVVIQ